MPCSSTVPMSWIHYGRVRLRLTSAVDGGVRVEAYSVGDDMRMGSEVYWPRPPRREV
jgi:hypothetical protein